MSTGPELFGRSPWLKGKVRRFFAGTVKSTHTEQLLSEAAADASTT